MKTLTILFACTAFMFTGCFPQAVVLWSPDGQHGAVMTKDKIYFCDPAGKLSEQSLATEGPAAWAPNANDFYYVSRISLDSWEKAKKYLTAAEQAKLIAQAKDALAKLEPGDMKDEKKNPFAKFATADIILMLLYLKDNHAAELKAKLDPQQQKDFLNNKIASNLYQLNVIRNCDFAKPQLILQTFREIGGELRPSPNGKAVAFVPGDKMPLYVCDMNGKLIRVAENTAFFPAWTPDGNSLVYSSTEQPNGNSNQLKLGSIKKVQIFNEQGAIPAKLPQPQELVGVLFLEMCNIRCLKNGWIIFSSAEITLPATTKGMPRSSSIFAIIPDLPSTVVNIISQEASNNIYNTQWDIFQLSPDEKKLAIISGSDSVAVYTFATGQVEKISVPMQNINYDLLHPTWQNNDTLCLLSSVQDDSGKMDVNVLLQSGNTKKIISESWPKAVMDSIIEKYRKNKETKSQPAATQPSNTTTNPTKK